MKFDRLNIIGNSTLTGLTRDRILSVSGNMEVRNNVIRWKLPYSITVKDAKVRLASAPTGSDFTASLLKNNTVVADIKVSAGSNDGTIFLAGTETPYTAVLSKDDVLSINIVGIGSTSPGANLQVQLTFSTGGLLIEAPAEEPDEEEPPILYDDPGIVHDNVITVTNSTGTLVNDGSTYTVTGMWRNKAEWLTAETPLPQEGGSLSSESIHGAIKIRQLFVMNNTGSSAADKYTLTMCLEGALLQQDMLDKINLKYVGDFICEESDVFDNTYQQNLTTWKWNLTKEQYDIIIAGGLTFRYNTQMWYLLTNQIRIFSIPSGIIDSYGRSGFRNAGANSTYPYAYSVFGALLNKTALSITNFSTRSYSSGANQGTSTDLLYFMLAGTDQPNSLFGCLRVEGLGNFTPTTVLSKGNAGDNTSWSWTISKECAEKTALDMPMQSEVVVDYRAYSTTKTINSVLNDVSSFYERRGYSVSLTGYHPAMGSLASNIFKGSTVRTVLVRRTKGSDYCILQWSLSGNIPRSHFDYLEVQNFGRFYSDEATVTFDATNSTTFFDWPISLAKFNSWTVSNASINFQLI